MQRLADETLVAAHKRVLARWKRTKPEQYDRLHESVRQDPIYRPLRPSNAEKEFYRDRANCLENLPRFQLRAIYDPRNVDGGRQNPVVIVEDRKRMGVYRATEFAIERGMVDWPTDVVEYARGALQHQQSVDSSSGEKTPGDPWLEFGFSEYMLELFPMDVVREVAANWDLNEVEVYPALDELQVTLVSELATLVDEYEVEEVADGYVVLTTEAHLIEDHLFGYSDEVRSAVRAAHALRCETSGRSDRCPIIVGGSEKTIERACKG